MFLFRNNAWFFFYCGKRMLSDDNFYKDSLSSERISSMLMQLFLEKGHKFVFAGTDNDYTNPPFAKVLLENTIPLWATIGNNRQNYSKELLHVQLDKGDSAFLLCENPKMVAYKYWQIRKTVITNKRNSRLQIFSK